MIKKLIGFTLFSYFLILLQTSFFVHFFGYLPNLLLIIIVLINLSERQKDNFGIFSGFIAGFFLDIFSENFIGYHVLICLSLSLFIKLVLKKYIK
ncbi:MAG: rod shape-determining protein MreD [Candidatus Nealsonbacteria bacterium]